MATSEVEVAQFALDLVTTKSSISSLTEGSPEANACNRWFDQTRDQLLRAAHWNFAKKTRALSLLKQAPGTPGAAASSSTVWTTDFPPPPWLYEYSYPSDCLLVRAVTPQPESGGTSIPIFSAPTASYQAGRPVRFEVQNDDNTKVITTNAYQAIGIYTYRVENVGLWDVHFTLAMQTALAAFICPTLTGDRTRAQDLLKQANDMIISARVTDGNEALTVIDQMPSTIEARLGNMTAWDYAAPYGPLFSLGSV